MAWELMAFVAAMIVIVTGCLLPSRWLPPLPNDKLCHFVAFAALTLLAARIAKSNRELLLWLCLLLLAGWLIECLQNWVPGRRFCWRDMAANAAGISSAALFSLSMSGI
jgi:VanZ family protein